MGDRCRLQRSPTSDCLRMEHGLALALNVIGAEAGDTGPC